MLHRHENIRIEQKQQQSQPILVTQGGGYYSSLRNMSAFFEKAILGDPCGLYMYSDNNQGGPMRGISFDLIYGHCRILNILALIVNESSALFILFVANITIYISYFPLFFDFFLAFQSRLRK